MTRKIIARKLRLIKDGDRDGCEVCDKFDFDSVAIETIHGDKPRMMLAGGSYRYPQEKQFRYCPSCGKKRR